MKIKQSELREYYEAGKTILLNYRKSYALSYNSNVQRYVFRSEGMPHTVTGQPYTLRGRYFAVTPDQAFKIIKA
tara:strand:+ start:219 stop:440 length:222 start_codon:yes stop_codon:yes gene_type:complete